VEVIVVDGGSTDHTVMTARELPLVNRVLQTTKGTSDTRNFFIFTPHSSFFTPL
jgi:glycosyltransferase involved in cell wall biosynthesis